MKIYPKNRPYIIFPEMTGDQDGWELIGDRVYSREECEAMKDEAHGYERTVNRLQVSKLRRRIEELTWGGLKWETTEHQ
jgi:hypothetical protein